MQRLSKKDILSSLGITLRLFAVSTVIAILVASVNYLTRDRINELENEKTTIALDAVFSDEGKENTYNIVETKYIGSVKYLYEVLNGEEIIGYGVICEPIGFKDVINMLVAFDNERAIAAVKVISMSETTGFGDKVVNEPWFAEQFVGIKNNILVGENIDAISGATVSSTAVTKGVNDAISMIKIYTSNMEVTE